MTIKDAKKNFITDVARDLFFEKSINEVTIKDIAQAAVVGEATVYRYFEHKQKIVATVAEKLQKKVYNEYFRSDKEGNGYAKIKAFYESYVNILVNSPACYKFVGEFDAYMISEGSLSSEVYSSGVDLFKNIFFSAYKEGIKDGSLKNLKNPEIFYFSTAHAMLELCKKLSAGNEIVKQDETTDKVAEICELKEIILSYIANPQA